MRGLLTLVVIVLALLVVLAVIIGGSNRSAPTPPEPAVVAPVEEAADGGGEVAAGAAPVEAAPAEAPSQPVVVEAIEGLAARSFGEARVAIIGSTDPDSGYKIEVDLSAWGASVMRIQLTDYMKTVKGEKHYVLLDAPIDPTVSGGKARLFPLAARSIRVNGTPVSLVDAKWELKSPGSYRTTYERRPEDANRKLSGRAVYALPIVDASGQVIVELVRTYRVEKNSYHVQVSQEIINRTEDVVNVVWEQRGIGDITPDEISYMGDRRELIAGYKNPTYDPKRKFIYTDGTWEARNDVLPESQSKISSAGDTAKPLWPNDDVDAGCELAWIAATNRYFSLVLHPDVPLDAKDGTAVAPLDSTFPVMEMARKYPPGGNDGQNVRTFALVQRTGEFSIGAGKTATLNVGLFAGPRKRDLLAKHPNDALQLPQLIKYELGCAFCTFQWLAQGLLAFLDAIHTVVRDWAVAIIILVLVVRLLLHPITKKSQVNMMMMGKQMQAMQPEIEKLKKKYGDDQQKFQAEQMKLWREKGVNPAGMLGCLPMFLQMPIWVALYAMLFLAIELRHQPAFYGVFQMMGGWEFLGDLSSPDGFIRFAANPVRLNFPLLSSLDFSTLNILPLLWAVVMFIQQKYTTPPPATEQAAQQQKMMKFMTALFPLFLYSAPSGLTLYILASTSAGVVDSYFVRKHIKEQEERGELHKPKKKPRKPGGLMDRISKAMEAKQREMMEQQQKQQRGQGKKKRK